MDELNFSICRSRPNAGVFCFIRIKGGIGQMKCNDFICKYEDEYGDCAAVCGSCIGDYCENLDDCDACMKSDDCENRLGRTGSNQA